MLVVKDDKVIQQKNSIFPTSAKLAGKTYTLSKLPDLDKVIFPKEVQEAVDEKGLSFGDGLNVHGFVFLLGIEEYPLKPHTIALSNFTPTPDIYKEGKFLWLRVAKSIAQNPIVKDADDSILEDNGVLLPFDSDAILELICKKYIVPLKLNAAKIDEFTNKLNEYAKDRNEKISAVEKQRTLDNAKQTVERLKDAGLSEEEIKALFVSANTNGK